MIFISYDWLNDFQNISVVEMFFTKKRNRILAETDVPPSYSVVMIIIDVHTVVIKIINLHTLW